MYELGFFSLRAEQSHFEVRKANTRVIDFHIRSGAVETGEDADYRYFIFPESVFPAFQNASAEQIKTGRTVMKTAID